MALAKSALAIAAAMIATTAWAEGPMSEELAWKLLELGRVIDLPKTAASYAPLQENEPYQGVKIERDVKYGPADRSLLDVFRASHKSSRSLISVICIGRYFSASRDRDWHRQKAAVWPLHPPRRMAAGASPFCSRAGRDWSGVAEIGTILDSLLQHRLRIARPLCDQQKASVIGV